MYYHHMHYNYFSNDNNNYEIKFYIWTDYDDRIRKYAIIGEIETKYIAYNEFTKSKFAIDKKDTYRNKDDLKYEKFKKYTLKKPLKSRIKYLKTTKQIEFRDKFMKEFPEKIL